MADQIQTDESISLVTALDEMRIVSENGFKKVEHLVIQGDHMKGKLQEMINKNDQMSELIRATYPGTALGNDTGDNDTGHRSVPVVRFAEPLHQYGNDATYNSYNSPYLSSPTASGYTALDTPGNEEYAGVSRYGNASTFGLLTGSKSGYGDVTQPRKVYKQTGADSSDGKWANARRHRVPPIKDPHKSRSSSISFASPFKASETAYDAYQLKRQFDQHSGLLPGGSKKAKGDLDPENRSIYKLRQNNMSFDTIAKKINDKRTALGKVADLTANAVYGRYKRNGPSIAAAQGEKFQQSQLDKSQGTLATLADAGEEVKNFDAEDDLLLVQAYNDVKDGMWALVSQRIKQIGGKHFEAKDCAARYVHL